MPPALTCQTFIISGLTVDVYSLSPGIDLTPGAGQKPLVVQFLLHAAFSSAKKSSWVVESFFAHLLEIKRRRKGSTSEVVPAELLIVTLVSLRLLCRKSFYL